MTFLLNKCKNKKIWDKFIYTSQQGSIFSTTAFLEVLEEDYECLFVEKNGKPQIGALILKHNNQPLPAPYPFSMYQGVFLTKEVEELASHCKSKLLLEAVDFLLKKLAVNYKTISFCFHYNFKDLRSFQWFNYHQPEKGQFNINLRYTGILRLDSVRNLSSYLNNIRKTRGREYKKFQAQGLTVEKLSDLDVLESLYKKTFKRQNIKLKDRQLDLVRKIAKTAVSSGFGELLCCKTKKGKIIAATLFLYDNQSSYYLIGANDPHYRKTGSSTCLMLENIIRSKQRGLKRLDFVGINSPNRGDFKTSFNAIPTPYFIGTWDHP